MPAKILVVDDEKGFQRLVKSFGLEINQTKGNKYDFIFASNGEEALEKIKSVPAIDLVLADIRMPKMDGLSLLIEINNRNFGIKTIIVTAYKNMTNIRYSMNLRAWDFLPKPFSHQELEQTIDNVLQLSSQTLDDKPTEESQKQIRSTSILKWAKELPISKRYAVAAKLIETFDYEELEDLRYKIEAQALNAKEIQAEKDEVLFKAELADTPEEELGTETLLTFLEKGLLEGGYIEERYTKRTLAKGNIKIYGPYYFLRWLKQGKALSRFLGREKPNLNPGSNIKIYKSKIGEEQQKLLEEETLKNFSEQSTTQWLQPDFTTNSLATNTKKSSDPELKETKQTPLGKTQPPIKLYGSEFDKLNSSKPKQN